MAAAAAFVKPPEEIQLSTGNPAHSWGKWKRRFEIYLQATGSSTQPGAQKVGLLLNTIGDAGIEIFANFTFDANNDKNDFDIVVEKFDAYFTKRDPQLMLREKFWFHLRREPGQSIDSWVNTVKEKAAECKFPPDYAEQAVRDKVTFSCTEDSAKLKLYDVGADLSLENAIRILALKEATKFELRETKSANIDSVRQKYVHKRKGGQKYHNVPQKQDNLCGYCNGKHVSGKSNCPAAKSKCSFCQKIGHFHAVCRSKRHVSMVTDHVSEVKGHDHATPTLTPSFVGGVDDKSRLNTGWHIRLCAGSGSEDLHWCIDTGAQVSVMPEKMYQTSFGPLLEADRILTGAGEAKLDTVGYVEMTLNHGSTKITEQVYIVAGASKLLLGVPAIRNLGLIADIPGSYSVKAVDVTQPTVDKENVVKEYPVLFTGLGKLKGEHVIHLRENATPFCLATPRRVPLPLVDKVKVEIEQMARAGVIEAVDEPTDWCAPIVVVPKQSGDVRICVDLTKLNEAVRRENYIIPKVESTLGSIASKGHIYTNLDANSGFHQVVLSEDSARLTTFITPFGRYMFRRLPFGISSAPEYFQKRMDSELSGLAGVVCHLDDILVIGRNQREHDERLRAVLDRLVKCGLTLNIDKCAFSQSELPYLGQIIDGDGIRIDPGKVKAIVEMAEPTDVPELRRFLGMVNQLMKFCPDLAEKTHALRELLRKQNAWIWGQRQKDAFSVLKEELSSNRVLALYDPKRETIVSADASSFGLGSVLIQKQPSGEMRPVAYASRSMTDTERRYAQIEKEALATTWALEHWADLLIGMHFRVETDHLPLVPLLSTKLLDELPLRIQRFRMRLMRYSFSIVHVPGKYLYTADALSRAPLRETIDRGSEEFQREVNFYVNAILVQLPASDRRLEEIRREVAKDDTLAIVTQYVKHGWPDDKRKVHGPVTQYWPERGNLSIHDGLLLRGTRLVVPPSLRCDILRYLHDCHQGITKTRQNAASSVWWPGISRDIEKMVSDCVTCEKYRRERIEPMKGTEFPQRPWSRVGVDFFMHKGHTYLLAIDYYSRDVEICIVTKKVDTSETTLKLKKVFSRHGIPDVLFSDNGPQFDSQEFRDFAQYCGFEHVTSSPRFPQSNGEVERGVQTMKGILNKCDDEYLALLTYRNTPLHNGYSPAQLSMGRRLKTRVPIHPDELMPQLPDLDLVRKREKQYRATMAANYDRRHAVVEGTPLSAGDRVWIPDIQTEGNVVRNLQAPRSVLIETPRSIVRRNRRMTRRVQQPTSDDVVYELPTVIDLRDPVNVPSDTDVDNPAALEHAAPAFSPRKSSRQITRPARYVEEC